MIEIEIRIMPLSEIHMNPDNPRRISDIDMDRLVKSLTDFPEMLHIREIVVDENMMVLGGNMRLLALEKAGARECRAKIVRGLNVEQKRRFAILDNSGYGEWDFGKLANEWSDLPLVDLGLKLPDDWMRDLNFLPGSINEHGRLDVKEPTICPHCGHSWIK